MPFKDIDNYGMIGDCRSAALVSSEGSIDWCCLLRFDSPAFSPKS
jgi:alpha,alpha-trehalase